MQPFWRESGHVCIIFKGTIQELSIWWKILKNDYFFLENWSNLIIVENHENKNKFHRKPQNIYHI
jgi:hypothetical protein